MPNLESMPPHFITTYVTAILLACVAIASVMLFIEFVATMTKHVMDQAVELMSTDMDVSLPDSLTSKKSIQSNGMVYYATPAALIHQVLDRTCPVSSHTPPEIPPAATKRTALPLRLRSPCALCHSGIAMGQLTRRLPCTHTFHARCIDAVCLSAVTRSTSCVPLVFQCPECHLRVFPTPDLIANDIIVA